MSHASETEGELASLRDVLLDATEFESTAEAVLRILLGACASALQQSNIKGRVLRGMVHLRPDGAYRSLVVLEYAAPAASVSSPQVRGDSPLPSATVWTLLERHGTATEVDVQLGRATPRGHATVELDPSGSRPDLFASRHRLLERSASHLLAIPLRARRPRAAGMFSIEIEARSAIGRALAVAGPGEPVLLRGLADRIELIADLAGVALASLPLGAPPVGAVEPDPRLPVIGRSMQRQIEMLRRFARQDETLLLCGPTGSGKSYLAEWCHHQSPRAAAPFESGDLLHKTDEMQMAELFGWRRGAFTGAVSDREGLVERVRGGTLFIDEIDKLSMKAQAGLLRFLETRRFRPMGDTGPERESDVRIIVGTNADLEHLVEVNQFREDLLYRINVLPVRLPPLRARKDEIAAWAEFMANRRHADAGAPGRVRISASAAVALTALEWPGNLRQLDNVIRRAHVIALAELEERATTNDLEITEEHIERATGLERAHPEDGVLETLRIAAENFASHALMCAETGSLLSLDLTEALRGLTLAAAIRLADGDLSTAMRALGKESLLSGRNHHKMIRREASRIAELCSVLGRTPHPDDIPESGD